MDDEGKISVAVRPASHAGADSRFAVSVSARAAVAELKSIIAEKSPLKVEEQRLIFKGKILKDGETLESYGIENDSVVHMVKGRPVGGTQSEVPSPAPVGSGPPGLGMGMEGMNGAAMRMMADNPALMRTLMQGNPQVQALIRSNPQFAEVFNNPSVLSDAMRAMSNPELMREQMRTNDVAMRNIETMPGGYNQLRTMFESMSEAMSTPESTNAQGSNPLAEVFGSMNLAPGGAADQPADEAAQAGNEAAAARPGLNEEPLPNPWQPPQSGGAAGAPLGLGAGLGGLLGSGAAAGGNSAAQQQMMQQMMSNPETRRSMATMMSDPALLDAAAQSNPAMRQMLDANPAMRSTLANPELMQQMLQPEVMQSIMQMMGGGGAAGNAQGVPDLNAMARALAPGAAAGSSDTPAGAQPGAPDMSALLGMLGGANAGANAGAAGGAPDMSAMLGALGGGAAGGQPDMAGLMAMLGGAGAGVPAPPPVANPEEAFETQLQQLKDMGFFDQAENIRALQATGGNVNAAIERLLA